MFRRLPMCALLALACLVSACGASSSGQALTTVALGDSVPRGTNCDCTPYPELTAADLSASSSRKFTATNDAVAGATTEDVLHQVDADKSVVGHLQRSNVVEIEAGANDVSFSSSCGTSVDCYMPRLSTMEKNLDAIVARVHELQSSRKLVVVLLDYWSVWLGGKYAAAKGDAYIDAAAEVTARVDEAIHVTAERTRSAYVDLRAAFKGPDYAYDETHYLSSDGDHPNAAGHRQIAAAAEAEIRSRLGV